MGSGNGTHRCPIGDCPAQIPGDRLMCPRHWRLVPSKLKPALRRASRDGGGTDTRTQQAAVRACLDAARAACQPACDQNLRQMVRRFLAGYRHPNHINGESWDEEDITRVMRCHPHKPDPRTRRCLRCGATLAT